MSDKMGASITRKRKLYVTNKSLFNPLGCCIFICTLRLYISQRRRKEEKAIYHYRERCRSAGILVHSTRPNGEHRICFSFTSRNRARTAGFVRITISLLSGLCCGTAHRRWDRRRICWWVAGITDQCSSGNRQRICQKIWFFHANICFYRCRWRRDVAFVGDCRCRSGTGIDAEIKEVRCICFLMHCTSVSEKMFFDGSKPKTHTFRVQASVSVLHPIKKPCEDFKPSQGCFLKLRVI